MNRVRHRMADARNGGPPEWRAVPDSPETLYDRTEYDTIRYNTVYLCK